MIFACCSQICNWFANWRRKLKNAGKEPQKKTWGTLIKSYNNNARGNVEQFSICSSDSIWEDEERRNDYIESKFGGHRDRDKFAHAIYYTEFQRLQHGYAGRRRLSEHPTRTCGAVNGTAIGDDETVVVRTNLMQVRLSKVFFSSLSL